MIHIALEERVLHVLSWDRPKQRLRQQIWGER